MYYNVLILLVGLFILILGGDFLVKGATNVALRFHISPLVVGLTIVAFGTSAPELLISVKAALEGTPDMTIGNVVGSNICNLALVLGVTALISPIHVGPDTFKIDWPVAMGSSLAFFGVAWYFNEIGMAIGLIFLTLIIIYIVFLLRKSRKENRPPEDFDVDPSEVSSSSSWAKVKDYLLIALGCAGLYQGAEWFVGGAKELASVLGVSQRVIGITVLALGTSLPELTTSIIASLKKETDLALGNLLGSNIFNVLSILGITSIITPVTVSQVFINNDMLWMLGITFVIFPFMFTGRNVARWEGGMLLVLYVFYIFQVIGN